MISLDIIVKDLNEHIIRNGLKQNKIAELAGITEDTLSKILTGARKSTTTDTLFAIMNAINMADDEVMLKDKNYKGKLIKIFDTIDPLPKEKQDKAVKIIEDIVSLI